MKRDPDKPRYWLRCLGLGSQKADHYFWSDGPRNRICPKCEKLAQNVRETPTYRVDGEE